MPGARWRALDTETRPSGARRKTSDTKTRSSCRPRRAKPSYSWCDKEKLLARNFCADKRKPACRCKAKRRMELTRLWNAKSNRERRKRPLIRPPQKPRDVLSRLPRKGQADARYIPRYTGAARAVPAPRLGVAEPAHVQEGHQGISHDRGSAGCLGEAGYEQVHASRCVAWPTDGQHDES